VLLCLAHPATRWLYSCVVRTSGMLALWHVVETGVFIVESWAASVSAHATTALTRRGLPKGLQVDAGWSVHITREINQSYSPQAEGCVPRL